jgi:AcrR family transcriptional regulator
VTSENRMGGDSDRRPGRPRSVAAHKAVLDAAADILRDEGLDRFTIERLSRRSGVSKATIYKWWSCKAEVALDAFSQAFRPEVVDTDLGDVARELTAIAQAHLDLFRGTTAAPTVFAFVAALQSHPGMAEGFRTRWLATRPNLGLAAVKRAKQRGQIRADVDDDIVLDLIFAPLWIRLLVGHGALDDSLAEKLVAAALYGVSPSSRGTEQTGE